MEQETKNGKGTGSATLFLSGAAIGAATALLMAPDSGKETRRKVGQWIKEKRTNGKEGLLGKKTRVGEALEVGKRAYYDAKEKLVGV